MVPPSRGLSLVSDAVYGGNWRFPAAFIETGHFSRAARVTADFMMDKTSASSRGTARANDRPNDLEEARLRQQAIGVKLRHMFDQVVNEPVPDEFLDILKRADDRSSGGSGA